MGIRVGIDLGTTFSAVAMINPATGKPEVIKNSFDSATTPSVLCFEANGNILFGEDAKNMQESGDTDTIAFFKRNMGKDDFYVDFHGKSYNPTDLSAILLRKLVTEAEQCSGEKIDAAVITVPAYFTHKERQATIDAGKKAGLEVIAIINEPTAAAFAYGLNDKPGTQTVLIYDLGGGTFDVTIARINQDKIEILGSDGNHELGGKDWDDCIAAYLARRFEEETGIDFSDDEEMIASMLVMAESVKKQLTIRDEYKVPIIFKGTRADITITEALFEEISEYLIGETKDLTNNLIKSIGLSWSDITGAILVGGSTRMRMVHNFVRDMSGKEPLGGVNVDEAVALGAAIRANIDESGAAVATLGGVARANECVIGAKAVSDVTAHALGMIAVSEDGEKYINSVIIPKNSSIPVEMKRSYKIRTRAKDNELEVYVLQGAYTRPLDNVILHKYVIYDIEKVATNPSIIEVGYKYNSDGIVEVSATQTETRKNLPVRIEPIPDDMSWTDGSPKDNETPGGAMPEVQVLLAIDLSGSMWGEPTIRAKEAMNEFVNQLDPEIAMVGVIAFADNTKLVIPPTDDFRAVHKAIDTVDKHNVGGANDAEPFTLTALTFKRTKAKKALSRYKDGDVIRYLVVLTDGCWSHPTPAIAKAKLLHKDGVEVMALGFGGADYHFLKQIASTDEFATMTNLGDLTSSFSKIAQAIGDNATGLSGL